MSASELIEREYLENSSDERPLALLLMVGFCHIKAKKTIY